MLADQVRDGGSVYFARMVYDMFGVDSEIVSPPERFTFENLYNEDLERTQTCLYREVDSVRPEWANVVHLMPVMGEVVLDEGWLARKPTGVTLAVNAQGYLREFGSEVGEKRSVQSIDRVFPSGIDILFYSEEDVEDVGRFSRRHPDISILVETRGDRGAVIRYDGEEIKIGALETEVVDPTGAGDVFAAAFVCSQMMGDSVSRSAQLATAFSALVISGVGGDALMNTEIADVRISSNEVRFER